MSFDDNTNRAGCAEEDDANDENYTIFRHEKDEDVKVTGCQGFF